MNSVSLFTLIGVITVMILAPMLAFGQGDYAACGEAYGCGDIQNISYPFSGAANRPAYCGYPGFNLSCESNNLMYRYQEISYRVLGINYTAQTVTVARNDLWDTLCPQTGYFNTSFNFNLFDYNNGGGDQNATLFYGCPYSQVNTIPNQFNCTLNESTTISYFWRTSTTLPVADIGLCSDNIFVPVNQTSAIILQNSPSVAGLRAALRSGFELRWTAQNTLCDGCVQSGGWCGSNTSSPSPTFACYCADRQYPERCNDLNGNEGGSAPPPEGKKKSMNVAVIVIPIVALISIAIGACFAWRRGKKKRGVVLRTTENRVKLEDIPIYSFGKLAAATGNFQSENKLGEGGFGPVYKGTLADGQEIAVKRLSRSSGQGLEEFMNEVVVISKLQHRNLVRLLGCCIEREEKMLVYEFMPNGGLHSLLYDQVRQKYLDWGKRVNIIEGIARGLLYLHRDSRLKIIHRDLKASNILLDQNLNPKISDFGMAKIFGDDKDQEKTGRVVGTYGYMSPEYAMEGSFSEKSDVYSFGVLLLEIVSGRRNSSFYNEEHPWNLSRLAWKLWNEEKILELIDPTICDPRNEREILRCVHVGLLCVQDFAKDRPTVSTVLSMLTSETADLPTPKEPAFVERHTSSENQASPVAEPIFSVNEASITLLEGR